MYASAAERRAVMSRLQNIREYLEGFLLYKHKLGYIYDTPAYYLESYVSFVEMNYPGSLLSKEAVDGYTASLVDRPGNLYGTVCALREFGRYLIRQGTCAYVLPAKAVRQPVPEPPYFFTEEEIGIFFTIVDSISPYAGYKGRELIVPALFRTMYCCGTRCREARLLRCENVSITGRYIDILQSKGPKSRRLYISGELAEYLGVYDCRIAAMYPGREYFFPGYRGRPYVGEGFIADNFRKAWAEAFPDFPKEAYPRAYDFRHHFAWANINRWAAGGLDVNAMLPYLMQYMGHKSTKQSLYYFHFVPEFYPVYQEIAGPSEDVLPEVPK